jgi:hypothetical protein
MFGTSWCPYLRQGARGLRAKGVRFTELDMEANGAAADFQRDVMGLQGFRPSSSATASPRASTKAKSSPA